MASIGITAFIHRACSSQHIAKKLSTQARSPPSLGTKHETGVVTPSVEHLRLQEKPAMPPLKTHDLKNSHGQSRPRFSDKRWKNGTWDLNMFVKNGRLDWDSVIVTEARRRKYLETHPEATTNEEPVIFRSSIIPWWAWILHSHLPETELLNGKLRSTCHGGILHGLSVDALTGLDVVGQSGISSARPPCSSLSSECCFSEGKKIADEATFYDKQWQASWRNPDAGTAIKEKK